MREAVEAHYGPGDLMGAVLAAFGSPGAEPVTPTPDELAPLDQFHLRGTTATRELARLAGLRAGMAVLDVGGGLGGPARTLAREFGCRVVVMDLTGEYCRVGRLITARTGLAARVAFVQGDGTALPFVANHFDAVWMQASAMNIEEKAGLYAECRRVLRPGGRLALQELATGRRVPLRFPVPWARGQALSFLVPPAALRELVSGAGFAECAWADVSAETLAWYGLGQQAAAPAPQSLLGLHSLLGADAGAAGWNLLCNLAEGRIAVVQGVYARP